VVPAAMKLDSEPHSVMPSSMSCPSVLSLYDSSSSWSTGSYNWPNGA
jgi:hypothetical protein